MSENILVVEYEPRYIERARAALERPPFACSFARDGEEALRAVEGGIPKLIVLSSVVPKISTTELIRMLRSRPALAGTPILLTVSGYNGRSAKADAQRVGASDILPKPYTDGELLDRVTQMLGIRAPAPQAAPAAPPTDAIQEDRPRKTMAKPTDDVDKMLADTLAGMMPRKKTDASTAVPPRPAAPAPAPPPPAVPPQAAPPPPPAAQAAPTSGARPLSDLDRRLHDTLSGLEKTARKTMNAPLPASAAGAAPAPVPPPAAPVPVPPPPRLDTERLAPAVPLAPPAPAPEPEEEPTDGTRFGQYVLLEKIATGGMAEVWKARMKGVEGFQKIVAIKKILPHLSDNQDFIGMFIDEAKLAAQLNHNNIIHIYDLGKIQSSYYIAMEYVDGYDLKNILRRAQEYDQPMGVELALFVASKIAAALDYAHRKRDFEDHEMGLVHRDVSPQNVLISQEGDIKLCDFGIAKAASKASHTQAGALKGKLQYMSPEQAWGRPVDRRSDVFALASVLFEMLTGRKLFAGDNEMSILEQVREAVVRRPSEINDEVTPEIDAVVLKALQKEPENRYQTAGEMARELDAILYSFRPTPTSADLAIFMHRLSAPQPVAAPAAPAPAIEMAPPPVPSPAFRSTPVIVPSSAPAVITTPAAAPAVEEARSVTPFQEPEAKKPPVMLFAVAAVVLALVGAGAFVLMRKSPAPAPAAGAKSVVPAAAATVPTTTAAAVPTDTTVTGTQAAALDTSAVDQEVQKRLAAERARLEAQARAQQPAGTPAATATRAAEPVQTAQVPVAAPPVAQPEQRQTAPVPEPVQQAPAPVPEPVRAAPAQPAAARAKEGDLVPLGTEGLTPPRMTRRGTVPYPAIARAQRVQGTILTSVLVSETGSVLEVKILRGVNRPVGLNEAAELTMRRSSFSPGTKDGVRVRTWLTVPVEFKL